MTTHSGLHWTAPEHDAIVELRDRGDLSPHQIAATLRAAGSRRSMDAIKKYIARINGGLPRPFDPALAAAGIDLGVAYNGGVDRAVQQPVLDNTGNLPSRIENVIPPIYRPDRPAPVAPEIVPVGEARVGVIGDTHIPFCLPDYREFCTETFAQWRCNIIVHIGDLVDHHAISFFKSDPDGMSAGREFAAAMHDLLPWYNAFPNVKWVTGNHDRRLTKRILDAGLPAAALTGNFYQTPPGWEKAMTHTVDGVDYVHGNTAPGMYGHVKLMKDRGCSVVAGHVHTHTGTVYTSLPNGVTRFGMRVGTGQDQSTYAMDYGEDYSGKLTPGCGVVLGGMEAHAIPMLQGGKS